MGSRTKNADKRKAAGRTGSNTAAVRLGGFASAASKPIFDKRKDDEREELDRMRAEEGSRARAEKKRSRRREKNAAALRTTSEIPLTPERVSAYTPPKKRTPAAVT